MNKPDASSIDLYTEEFDLIPLHIWDQVDIVKDSEGNKKKLAKGKIPIGQWRIKDTKIPKLRAMVEKGHNFGVRLQPGQLVVDVDPRNMPEDRDTFKEFCEATGLDPANNVTVQTGSGGFHVYLTTPKNFKRRNTSPDYPGIEFKGPGQQVVGVGSLHPDTGIAYKLIGDEFWALSAANDKVLDIAHSRAREKTAANERILDVEDFENLLDKIDPAKFPDNDSWIKLAMSLHDATGGCPVCGELFDLWCQTGPGYKPDVQARWESFDVDKNSRLGVGTLKHILGEVEAEGAQRVLTRALDRVSSEKVTSAADDFADEVEEPEDLEALVMECAKGGKAYRSRRNARTAIKKLGIKVRFNEQTQSFDMSSGERHWPKQIGDKLNDKIVLMIRAAIEKRFLYCQYEMSEKMCWETLYEMGLQNIFNPVHEYLDSLEWDGVSRIDRLFVDYFQCGDSPFVREVGRAFMIGAVARTRIPGCKRDEMPIIKGRQGIGKSTGISILGGDFFSDADLGKLNDTKNAVEILHGTWIHEISEIDKMTRHDTSLLKAFISRTTDRFRPAFGKVTEDFPRRSCFIGTCNEGGVLKDATGNRRFWVLEAQAVDMKGIEKDRDQLWAEAQMLFALGDPWFLNESVWAEGAERAAEETTEDPWADAIRELLEERLMVDEGEECPPENKIWSSEIINYVLPNKASHTKDKMARLRVVMENTLGWQYKKQVRIGKTNRAGYAKTEK